MEWAKSHPTMQPSSWPLLVIAAISNFWPGMAHHPTNRYIKWWKENTLTEKRSDYQCSIVLPRGKLQQLICRFPWLLPKCLSGGGYALPGGFSRWSSRPLQNGHACSAEIRQHTKRNRILLIYPHRFSAGLGSMSFSSNQIMIAIILFIKKRCFIYFVNFYRDCIVIGIT